MMKKILTFSVVLAMALVMLSGPAIGYGEELQGVTVDSNSGASLLGDAGNVTIVHVQDSGDIPVSTSGFNDNTGYTPYRWDASGSDNKSWVTPPATEGDDLYFIKEAGGCIAATYVSVTATTTIHHTQFENADQLETIPVPQLNENGTDYINITIPAFHYTGMTYNGNNTDGTFDVVTSYAVFYREEGVGASWSYAGNAENFVAGPDSPVEPMGDDTGIDTGHYTFNTSTDGGLTLTAGTDYEFMVRVNIGPTGALGGYGGGLGSYTTYSAGASSGPISTQPPDTPEFPTILVPVMATMGLFIAAVYYRRRKD